LVITSVLRSGGGPVVVPPSTGKMTPVTCAERWTDRPLSSPLQAADITTFRRVPFVMKDGVAVKHRA
jgi:hypothetical protein